MSKGAVRLVVPEPLSQVAESEWRSVIEKSTSVPAPNVEPLVGWLSRRAGAVLSISMAITSVRELPARSVAVTERTLAPSAHPLVSTSYGEASVWLPWTQKTVLRFVSETAKSMVVPAWKTELFAGLTRETEGRGESIVKWKTTVRAFPT